VSKTIIRAARAGDESALAEMQSLLWPDASPGDLLREVQAAIEGEPKAGIDGRSAGKLPSILLIAVTKEEGFEGEGLLSGFIAAGLRSHADGCDPAQPVGYIEGWFVREPVRGRGIGKALIDAAESWARGQGCVEMASDALIDNLPSQHAHQSLGFEVVDRCVHYRKTL
jgi:aminoglycoside 6'-N-acetyltransferase I